MCEINRIWKAFPLKCASNPRLHARLWGQMTEWSIGFQADERLVSDSALAASPAGKRRKERESGGLCGGGAEQCLQADDGIRNRQENRKQGGQTVGRLNSNSSSGFGRRTSSSE